MPVGPSPPAISSSLLLPLFSTLPLSTEEKTQPVTQTKVDKYYTQYEKFKIDFEVNKSDSKINKK
jgi:hypothetical protein